MLELKSISWQNFLSYGDYPTTIQLDNLGQCLITGEVFEDEKIILESSNPAQIKRSNGAGKSTIPSVIQWALFGRTMHSRSPGNNVINWHTGKNCWAKLEFKNGDSILRTRNVDGKNELIYFKDGDEKRLVSDTVSTSMLQQQQLNRDYGLDWEIFCGSVFFNQYGKPWMEMADATRKKAIERVLHVDRFGYYAQACKIKCDNLDKLVDKLNNNVVNHNAEKERLNEVLVRLKESSDKFSVNQTLRATHLIDEIKKDVAKRDAMDLPDLVKLKSKWDLVSKILNKINEKRIEYNKLSTEIADYAGQIRSVENKIDLWIKKSGKMCTSCEQTVECVHIDGKMSGLKDELSALKNSQDKIRENQLKVNAVIAETEKLLKERTPSTTMRDAESVHYEYKKLNSSIEKSLQALENIKNEVNPHSVSIKETEGKIAAIDVKLADTMIEHERSELLNKHYHYVYKAYNDRNKIKSYIFREHIPFINSRLKHYMDVFGLDIQIKLTESLGIESNLWGYEFESGGERKRTDVAFMLAMFDFHEQMYGRQCNVLILDEVDGRMDEDGIDSLISVIKNDLAHRVETIMVISHRNMMFDTFPKEVRVTRKNRLSNIEIY